MATTTTTTVNLRLTGKDALYFPLKTFVRLRDTVSGTTYAGTTYVDGDGGATILAVPFAPPTAYYTEISPTGTGSWTIVDPTTVSAPPFAATAGTLKLIGPPNLTPFTVVADDFFASNPPNTFAYPGAPTGSLNGIVYAPPPSGSAATDTANLQTVLNYVAGGPGGTGVPAMTVQLGPGTYLLNATLTIYRKAIILRGQGVGNPKDFVSNPGLGTTLRWAGAAGIAMLQIQDTRSVNIEDIYFQGNTANPPLCGIEFFQGASDSIGVNRNMSIERCLFGYLPWATGGTEMTYCIAIDGTNANNQMHYFRDCQFNRPLTAGTYLPNSQSIWCKFDSCSWDGNNVAKGLVTYASTTIVNGQFGQCTTDLEIQSTARVSIFGYYSENAVQWWNIVSDGSLFIQGGVLSALTPMQGAAQCAQSLALTNDLTIDGVWFNWQITPHPPLKVTGAYNPYPYTFAMHACKNFLPVNGDLTLTGYGAPGVTYVDLQSADYSMRRTVAGLMGTTDVIWTTPTLYRANAVLTGQTTAQTLATTPASATNDSKKHLVRVSGTVTITTLGSGNINLQVAYTDDNGTARTCNIPLAAEAGTYAASANTADAWKGSLVIAVNPNTTITLATAGTFTGCTYNAGGTIEMLSGVEALG